MARLGNSSTPSQFERYFDPTSTLPLFASTTSPRRSHPAPYVRGSPSPLSSRPRTVNPNVFAQASPRTVSQTTAKTLKRQQEVIDSRRLVTGHAPSAIAGSPFGRGARRPNTAPRMSQATPGSPAAASAAAVVILRLSGALDKEHVPQGTRQGLRRLREEAAMWDEAQVRHQCERGVVSRLAGLLRVPSLQVDTCGLMADLGERWPAALAGAAGEIASLLPLPLARLRPRQEALRLLVTLAACGENGRLAIIASPGIMEDMTQMLSCEPMKAVKQLLAVSPGKISPGKASGASPDVKSRQEGAGEVWGPGQPSCTSIIRNLSPGRLHVQSASPSLPSSFILPSPDLLGTALLEAAAASRVLLSLLSSAAASAETCRLHGTATDPVGGLFSSLASLAGQRDLSPQEASILKLTIGKISSNLSCIGHPCIS